MSGTTALSEEKAEALLAAAEEARKNAYAPYSGFTVGAALLFEDGRVVTGCNVENAAFGSTICAERTALLKAISEGHREDWVALAIAGQGRDYCWPCGSCRQMLYEFAPGLRVLAARGDGEFCAESLEELLPHGFGPSALA